MLSKKISEKDFNEYIRKIEKDFIINEDIFNPTSSKFMGFNFSIKDRQVCIYDYMPSNNIISVLESIQIDLLSINKFNIVDYLLLDKKKQLEELNKFKYLLTQKVIKENDSFLLHIFEELYLNNKNIKNVQSIYSEDKIRNERVKILSLASKIPSIQIK